MAIKIRHWHPTKSDVGRGDVVVVGYNDIEKLERELGRKRGLLYDRIAELERELAQRDTLIERIKGSSRLDDLRRIDELERELAEARRLAIQALDGWDDVSRDLHHYHGSGEWHQDSRNTEIRAAIDDAGAASSTDADQEGE